MRAHSLVARAVRTGPVAFAKRFARRRTAREFDKFESAAERSFAPRDLRGARQLLSLLRQAQSLKQARRTGVHCSDVHASTHRSGRMCNKLDEPFDFPPFRRRDQREEARLVPRSTAGRSRLRHVRVARRGKLAVRGPDRMAAWWGGGGAGKWRGVIRDGKGRDRTLQLAETKRGKGSCAARFKYAPSLIRWPNRICDGSVCRCNTLEVVMPRTGRMSATKQSKHQPSDRTETSTRPSLAVEDGPAVHVNMRAAAVVSVLDHTAPEMRGTALPMGTSRRRMASSARNVAR